MLGQMKMDLQDEEEVEEQEVEMDEEEEEFVPEPMALLSCTQSAVTGSLIRSKIPEKLRYAPHPAVLNALLQDKGIEQKMWQMLCELHALPCVIQTSPMYALLHYHQERADPTPAKEFPLLTTWLDSANALAQFVFVSIRMCRQSDPKLAHYALERASQRLMEMSARHDTKLQQLFSQPDDQPDTISQYASLLETWAVEYIQRQEELLYILAVRHMPGAPSLSACLTPFTFFHLERAPVYIDSVKVMQQAKLYLDRSADDGVVDTSELFEATADPNSVWRGMYPATFLKKLFITHRDMYQ
jgi:hypothetical protein